MKIKKAVITAAGRNQRGLPLQTLVDRDRVQKTALRIIVEEALNAGMEEVCVVIHPGDHAAYVRAAGDHARQLRFVEQTPARGYGHAVLCAHEFIGNDPFLHLVGDHLYLSRDEHGKTCARQLVEIAEAEQCAVSAVQPTRETMLTNYGTVGGKRVPVKPLLYNIERVLEKPTPTEAEQSLIVPGLRAGYYLCFFGIHVLTPAVMEILERHAKSDTGNVHLSPALAELAGIERYLAYEMKGRRYDIGVQYGLLVAQLALAFAGPDRAEVLAELVELLATGRD